MRALASAMIVFAGSMLVAVKVQTAHLHPDRWGLFFGLPLAIIGLAGWYIEMFRRGGNGQPKG